MPEMEYNNLLYQISKRLDEMNVGEQLLVMCRGKVTVRSGEDFQTFSLFEELEQKGYLSPDHLVLLKGMLKGVNEWALFDEVEKFETNRKEYKNLLEQSVRVLDEPNELERLVSICGEKITEESRGNVRDVRSLFKELESNDWLGIDCLDTVKEILTQREKNEVLKEVEEFELRRSRENKFRKRKAQADSFLSTVRDKLAGVLNIKTVFKAVSVGFKIASSLALLLRDSTYDQLVAAVNDSVLPAGANLIQISEGCVSLKVQVVNLSALETLWRLYQDGTLEASLQALFVTDEMRELAGGEQVEAVVTIAPQEYEKARDELAAFEEQEDDPLDGRKAKRLKLDEDQDKSSYIQNWFADQSCYYIQDSDKNSTISETGDSGIGSSFYAPSDLALGIEDTSVIDYPSLLYVKDLKEEVTAELACRLQADPVALERFCKSFGLDSSQVKLTTTVLLKIREFFPDTSVQSLKDVFKTLKLYDLVETLEEATKPRALRPRLSLKEIENLTTDVKNRPTKFYNRAEVLIINFFESDPKAVPERIGSFFQDLSSKNRVTALTADTSGKLFEHLAKLKENTYKKDNDIGEVGWKLEKMVAHRGSYEEEQMMQRELKELAEKREKLTKEKIQINEEMMQKKEELDKENEKFKLAVTDVVDKWIEQSHDDKNSTLFVVFSLFNGTTFKVWAKEGVQYMGTIEACLTEKLELIHDTKLLITGFLSSVKEIPSETLQLCNLDLHGLPTMMLEILNKRWQTLDLISMMQELQRTCIEKISLQESQISKKFRGNIKSLGQGIRKRVKIHENLSCLPRLQADDGTNVKEL